jgi:hypothetical protein
VVNRARVRGAVGELPGGGRLSDEAVDELLADARTEQAIFGPGGVFASLTKRLVERALAVGEQRKGRRGERRGERLPPGGRGLERRLARRRRQPICRSCLPVEPRA